AEFPQMDQAKWPELKERVAALFLERTRDDWCALLEGTDVCFAPVLSIADSREHPHNTARGTFIEINGVGQPRPCPRFSRTDSKIERLPPSAGEHTDEILTESGFGGDEIKALREAGAVG
ncbi:MAG: CoA transferase, partial [bacterium]